MCRWMSGVELRSVLHVALLSSISGAMRLLSNFRTQLLNFACAECGRGYKGCKTPSRSFMTRSKKGIWLPTLIPLADLGDSEKLGLRGSLFRRRHLPALPDSDIDNYQLGWFSVCLSFFAVAFLQQSFPSS
mmetsp:Transcript_22534/g.54746  ORF Transcript_22534/g.54746 Transcript_22534/m.54746 type:complete len:131 (+) Transcript_22534:654-1046(+)